VGTLTGGGSYCNQTNAPDYYGKMSYHWLSNGTAANRRLKTHLDPGNTGLLVLNGSSNPCSLASISENNPLNAISVYPNPTSDVLFVDLSEISDETVMELYDITGKLLQKSTVISGGMETLSLQSFSPGIYQLRLINKGAETIQRIVKE
jgi:hypothetical protein